jgi:hypothetical protein
VDTEVIKEGEGKPKQVAFQGDASRKVSAKKPKQVAFQGDTSRKVLQRS